MSFLEKAKNIADYINTIREDIHMHPERGFEEFKTSELVATQLEEMGYDVMRNVAETGVVGVLKKGKGKTVGIRADMDALPVHEETGLPCSSKIDGVMHACGHDTHVAMALGAAKILAETEYNGTVKMIFQPAEEGPTSGGLKMVEEGVLDDVDFVIGQHQHPLKETGKIFLHESAVMSATDIFQIEIQGLAAHGGSDIEKGIDSIVIASHIITNIQAFVARMIAPLDTCVFTVGSIHGGAAPNIVCDKVEMTGNIRTLIPKTREMIHDKLAKLLQSYEVMYGAKISLNFSYETPAVINDPNVLKVAKKSAHKVFGEKGVVMDQPSFAGEDFARMASKCPAVFAHLGTANKEDAENFSWHHSKMSPNKEAFPYGTAWLCETALDLIA